MLLQHRRGHLGMFVIVMFDEVGVAHASFLSHEDGGFDDFAEACRWGVAGFKDHGGDEKGGVFVLLFCLDAATEVVRSAVDLI